MAFADVVLYDLLYIIVFITTMYFINKRLRSNGFVGAYSGLTFGVLLYYAIIPLIITTFSNSYLLRANDYRYDRINKWFFGSDITSWDRIRASLMVIVGLIGIEFGYRCKRRRTFESVVMANESSDEKFYKTIRTLALLTLFAGGFSVILYTAAFGGLTNALQLAEILRQHYSSVSDYGISGVYSYFLLISGVLTISPILFYYLWKKQKTGKNLLLFVVSIVFASIYLLLNSGKSAILRLGIVFFYMFLHEKKIKHKALILMCAIIVGLPMMDIFDAIFAQEDLVETIKNFSYLYCIREFAVPAELTFSMDKICDRYGYMYFSHFVTDFLDILPGMSFPSSFANTSEFMKGANWMRLGGTPNDLITYGFLQLRAIGVFVTCSIWGYLSGWLDNLTAGISDETGKRLIGITVCMNMVSVITCADISSTILYNLSFILVAIVLGLYARKIRRS